MSFIFSSGPFSSIDGNNVLPSRFAVAREIARQADVIRRRLGVQLSDAAKQGSLAISPDLWTDKFKQNSYLGLTAHFIDDDHILHSIDTCCEPYHEINKPTGNVLKVRNEIEFDNVLIFLLFVSIQQSNNAALSRFELDHFMDKITCVCDRDSNLVKALEGYQVVHYFPHRLNNVLKRTFYSADAREKLRRRQRKLLIKSKNGDQSV